MTIPSENIRDECARQEDNCLYASATLFEFLKRMRIWRGVFITAPIIAGGIATSVIVVRNADLYWLSAICALIAGTLPAIYKGWDFDVSLDAISKSANRFKALQDRFRQLRLVGHDNPEQRLSRLMDQLDEIRLNAPVAPEPFFSKARDKIKKGHYIHDVDKK